jgi:RNA polymerase sigma-70 factor, ECF subfamily
MRMSGMVCAAQNSIATHSPSRQIGSCAELVRAIHAVAEGDEVAFASVYAATATKLFGAILRIVCCQDLAEDVLQEVYVRIWQHAHTFDHRFGSPITWMTTIARHRALDEVRQKNAVISITEYPEVLHLASKVGPLARDEDGASQDLAAALQRLSGDKRSMLVQAYCYGHTREEIAKRTGRPISTVKTSLRRALAELRVYLTEQESTALSASACLASPICASEPRRRSPSSSTAPENALSSVSLRLLRSRD